MTSEGNSRIAVMVLVTPLCILLASSVSAIYRRTVLWKRGFAGPYESVRWFLLCLSVYLPILLITSFGLNVIFPSSW